MSEDTAPRAVRFYLIITAFLSGFAVMVIEMAAVRAVAPYFGATTYTWTNVIGVILAALAAGYFLGGRVADRLPSPSLLYGIILCAGLLSIAMPLLIRPVAEGLLSSGYSLEGALDVVYRASLVATLVLFAPPTLILGAVSPMTIKLLAGPDRVGGAAGQVFAASTLGSIVGTFMTTFTLVPELGTRMTIGLAGGTLAATAVLGFLLTCRSRTTVLLAAAGAGAAVLLLVGVANAGPLKESDGQLLELESAYQYLRVRDVDQPDGKTLRMLQINEAEAAYQSVKVIGSPLTGGKYYDYYAALPLLLGAPERGELDVLVVGLAAGTIPTQLRHFFPEGLEVTGVEIDPAVIELGRQRFDLPAEDGWLKARVADGRVFLRSLPPEPAFDLVIIDAFAQEYYIPFHLATKEAFREVLDRLRPGGILAMNVSAFGPDSALLESIEATLVSVFGKGYRLKVIGYSSFVVFGVKDAAPQLGRLREAPESGPDGWNVLREYAAYMERATSAIRPSADALVLTDDRAPVERLTDRGVGGESRAVLDD